MKYTSIKHFKNKNVQADYSGAEEFCIYLFTEFCENNPVVWAQLFKEEDGEKVATYNKRFGCVRL